MSTWTLYFDGLCEPRNPGGRMAWGWVIQRPEMPDSTGTGSVPPHPSNTNNAAEYRALGFGLRDVQTLMNVTGLKPDKLVIRGDSKLAVYGFSGAWKCKAPNLIPLRDRCRELLAEIVVPYEMEWVPREQNELADAESRRAYTDAEGKAPPERRKAG